MTCKVTIWSGWDSHLCGKKSKDVPDNPQGKCGMHLSVDARALATAIAYREKQAAVSRVKGIVSLLPAKAEVWRVNEDEDDSVLTITLGELRRILRGEPRD
jgi:hypothetical protein